MSQNSPAPGVQPESVRTLLVDSPRCPVCRRVALRGRQTVCSPACRRRRSRQREAEARADQAAEVRRHAEAIIRLLDGGRT